MGHPRIIEGTSAELVALLQGEEFGQQKLRLIVDSEVSDEEDYDFSGPVSFNTQAELEELLIEGLNSGESTPMTAKDWEDLRNDLRIRSQQRTNASASDA